MTTPPPSNKDLPEEPDDATPGEQTQDLERSGQGSDKFDQHDQPVPHTPTTEPYLGGSTQQPTQFFAFEPESAEPSGTRVMPAQGDFSPSRVPDETRDRVWPHLVWELLLAVVAALLVWWLWRDDDTLFSGSSLNQLLLTGAFIGALGAAMAWSLRAGVPNLMIGAAAVGAGLTTGWLINERGWELSSAVIWVMLGAIVVGALLGLFVVLAHVPAWGASAGMAILGAGLLLRFDIPLTITVGNYGDLPDLTGGAKIFAGVVVALSLLGGILWALTPIRTALSTTRGDRDPASRPNKNGALGALAALVGSTVLASAAGIFSLLITHTATMADAATTTGLALAVALVGGVSIFGRLGGFLGTIVAAAIVTLLWQVDYWRSQEGTLVMIGAGLLLGLLVSRLVESVPKKRLSQQMDE